ncbi:MAG: adenylosuccinate synthase [Polyangiaceae bacterium]
MTCIVVVGAQWGDEGKGKVVDFCTERADVVARYAGGPNAGHTLVVGGEKTIVRLLPSGILHADTRCVLGDGMVVDAAVLLGELDTLQARGVPRVFERVLLGDRAHLILPYHIAVDAAREARAATALGTTKKGIGPTYEDKVRRVGVRTGDLRDPGRLRQRMELALSQWAPTLRELGGNMPSVDSLLAELEPLRQRLVPLLGDASAAVNEALGRGARVVLEGAQGALLDVDYGTYPFVTSSSAIAGGACTGLGLGPSRIDSVLGIAKAYTTRVGSGPFPTELSDARGEHLRNVGVEFGSVTGRPRRTGWLDLVALRYAARINGLDAVALTKLDVLSRLDEVRVCVAYRTSDGETRDFVDGLDAVEPVYEVFEGWSDDITGVRRIEDLPAPARRYLDALQEALSLPFSMVGVGPGREATLVLRDPFLARTRGSS